jgi:hypothetical protein
LLVSLKLAISWSFTAAMNFQSPNLTLHCRPEAQQITPQTQFVQPAPSLLPQKPFLMPTPSTAPISLFGGNLTITPTPAATSLAASASMFSVASLTAAAPLLKTEPPPAAATPATLDLMAPTPQKIVPAAAVEIKKEVVSEPVLSEESFMAASTAVKKLFSDELTTSLRQSLDATYTVQSHNKT